MQESKHWSSLDDVQETPLPTHHLVLERYAYLCLLDHTKTNGICAKINTTLLILKNRPTIVKAQTMLEVNDAG